MAALAVSPASAQVPPGGRISLASQTAWVGAGQSFELRVDLAGVRRPEDLELVVGIHEAVTSRSQFRQTLDGRLLGQEVWRSGPTPLDALGVDAAGAVPFTVGLGPQAGAAGTELLTLTGAGVHPVRVELRQSGSDDPADAFTTYLVRTRDDNAPPLAVAWVQHVAAPIALRPDGAVVLDDEVEADVAGIVTALGTGEVPLTLAPRPETLDALVAVEPELVADLADRLGNRQVVAGPYVDVPAAALVTAGLPDVIEAEHALGAATVARVLGSADATTWVSDGPVEPDVLAVLDTVERLVVPEDSLVPLDRPLTLANPFLVEDAVGRPLEAAAVDPGLAAHFDEDGTPVLGAHHLLADLAVLAYDSPGLERGVVVAPPPEWTPSVEFLSTALPALANGPVVRAVTLDRLFDEVPLASGPAGDVLVRTLQPDPSPPSSVATTELRRILADVASVAAMIDARAPTIGVLERLALTSVAASLSPDERAEYRAGVGRVIARDLARVGILSQGSFQLTSREATIPLTLVNDLETDVDVTLELRSDKLDFVPPSTGTAVARTMTMALTLAPGRTPLMVPVEARASGDFPLLITMRSPDNRVEIATTRLMVRSTFPSGVGYLLSAGAGLFLALWWGRHWRTARRDRRLVAPPA